MLLRRTMLLKIFLSSDLALFLGHVQGFKCCEQTVVINLCDRFKFVIMAARTLHGLPEKCHRGRRDHVVESIVDRHFLVGSNGVKSTEAEEGRCDLCARIRIGDLIPGELFGNELIVGQIPVEGIDDVVAVAPGEFLELVTLITFGLGVARDIEPVPPPAFAILWPRQEIIDNMLECTVGRIARKRPLLFRRWRQADQIEVDAP